MYRVGYRYWIPMTHQEERNKKEMMILMKRKISRT